MPGNPSADAAVSADDDAAAGLDAATAGNPDAATPADAEPSADAEAAPDAMPARTGLGILGFDSHSVAEVEWTEIGANGHRVPRDLAFDSLGNLWVVNRRDDSTITYFNVGSPQQTSLKRIDPFAMHFMEEVSSIAFGAEHATYGHQFGTCQESTNTYNGQAQPNNFMGPSLWPSAMDVYAHSNPAAVTANGFDLGSHLDMLHQSPLCMGIAWDHDNVYWTFDGASGSISRYDFQADHAPGYDDHSDGIIARYVTGQVSRVADVPSHLELEHATGMLFIADTGNARIAVLDTASGTRGGNLTPRVEPGTQFYSMSGATLTTLVETAAGELGKPSGLAMFADTLFVTDNANGRISAFDKNTGARLDYLDTGLPPGALMGITTDNIGRLYFVDAVNNKVIRVGLKQ